jgi:hypothetical protein
MPFRALIVLLSAVWVAGASGHTDEHFDRHPSPHGGQVRMAGPYHIELVAGENQLTLYITDHADNPVQSAGGSAKAIVMTAKKRYVLVLAGAGDNKLEGIGEFKLGKPSHVTVIVKLPETDSQLARFTVNKKPKAHSSRSHPHQR